VNEIVLFLSLGLLALWIIGPFAVFVVYHVPRLPDFLDSILPLKTVNISASRNQMDRRLSYTPPLCRLPSGNSFDSFDPFNFFNFDIFDFWQSPPENSETYGTAGLERALPLLVV
jgi:hypothetical protein